MRTRRRAFTLIELLLVMAIIAIVSAIVMPSFVRSIRGNRLRTAARTVVMAGRYARSMAVLQQREMAVSFDFGSATIRVGSGGAAPAPAAHAKTPEDGPSAAAESEGPGEPPPIVGEDAGVSRTLDRVHIRKVELLGVDNDSTATNASRVAYYSNGTCQPHRVLIADEFGESVTVTVDSLSTAETESGEER